MLASGGFDYWESGMDLPMGEDLYDSFIEYQKRVIEELDVLYAEGAKTGRIMNVGLHPHVSGRAHRVRALREFIEHAKSLPGVWWATREEIARWYLANHESHIPNQLGDRG